MAAPPQSDRPDGALVQTVALTLSGVNSPRRIPGLSHRHPETLGFSESLLIRIKGEELGCLHFQGACHMEKIKSVIPSGEGAYGRESSGLIHHLSQIGGCNNQAALGDSSRSFEAVRLTERAEAVDRRLLGVRFRPLVHSKR